MFNTITHYYGEITKFNKFWKMKILWTKGDNILQETYIFLFKKKFKLKYV